MKPASRSNNFDLLRLLAASQVLLVNAELLGDYPVGAFALLGLFPGVPVFSAISGFLNAASLESHPDDLSNYFRKRFLRIYPALWGCLAVSIGAVLLLKPGVFLQASPRTIAIWVACQATIVQFWNPDFLRTFGLGVLNGSLWAIPVQIQFYLILPLLYRLPGWHKDRRKGVLIGLIVVFGLLNWQMLALDESPGAKQPWFKLYRETFVPNIFMFLVGVYFKRNFERLYPLIAGQAWKWAVVYVPTVFLFGRAGLHFGNPFTQVLLAFVIFSFAYSWPLLSERLLRGNDISYGIYLYNMVVINCLRELAWVNNYLVILFAVLSTWALGAISWRFLEAPALKLKNRTGP